MQMTARLRSLSRRAGGATRSIGKRHLALASVALFVTQCAPQQCAPEPAPAPAPAPAPGGSGYFGWSSDTNSLPSGAQCAAAVRRGQPEIRPDNKRFNDVPGSASAPQWPRVDGNFTGTTDEIIQWAACKWGFDENTLRAQAAKESYWSMLSVGDNGESFGIMQVRTTTFPNAGVFPNAQSSTAFNIDLYLATWRDCYDGKDTWLNTVERGGQYAAGDAWGCIGKWFSGRWYTQPSVDYIHAVQDYLNQQIWLQGGFRDWRP
jgi:hypothetical protein